mmetsp:Transcript_26076/g.38518  ORF Transcript_26076/g.38518 Transcript_26076/m.38518 type:complete len:113 (+) Transcript_26076:1-339(+)
MDPDAYTFTILLSVCSNLLPKEDRELRFAHAKSLFDKCCAAGYVNDYVLRKLRLTVTEDEYLSLVGYRGEALASNMPPSWVRNARFNQKGKQGRGGGGGGGGGRWNRRRGVR